MNWPPLILKKLKSSSPSTNNSNQTWRCPTCVLGSSSRAHFASKFQSYFCFVGQKPLDSPLFCALVISFSCKASCWQHNLHKDLVSHFECQIYKSKLNKIIYIYMSRKKKLYSSLFKRVVLALDTFELDTWVNCRACLSSSMGDNLLCPCGFKIFQKGFD